MNDLLKSSAPIKTPEGMRDLLFYDGKLRVHIETPLRNLYRRFGYSEVKTPVIEYYNLFSEGVGAIGQTGLFTCSDFDGRLLALRADSTKPIARLFAAHKEQWVTPARFFYGQSVARRGRSHYKRRVERYQTGVELIGDGTLSSDIEILSLAADSLKSALGDNFRIELGHSGILRSLLESADLTPESERKIRALVAEKSYPQLEEELDALPETARIISELPRLFGTYEVLDKYEALSGHAEHTKRLRELYAAMCELGYEKNFLFDLATQNQYGYYTGIVFKGFAVTPSGDGREVLSGGRYDTLFRDFGLDLPAVGFAIDLDETAEAYAALKLPTLPDRRVVIVYGKNVTDAIAYVNAHHEQDIKYEIALGTLSEAKEKAALRGAELYVVGGEK